MRRQIRRTPDDLPHARLYLDDLEAIEQIILDELSKKSGAAARSDVSPKDMKVVYELADEEMDSITDLQDRGGSTTTLRVRARDSWPNVDLNIGRSCYMHSYGLGESANWSLYARVHSVFERRQMRLKNLVRRVPTLAIMVLFGIGALINSVYRTSTATKPSQTTSNVLLPFSLVGLAAYRAVHHRVFGA